MQDSQFSESSPKQAQIREFVESETEKIYMIIGSDEISLYRFMEGTLKNTLHQGTRFVFNYEIWAGEHSRHFLFRWLQETFSGRACQNHEAWSAFLEAQPHLRRQLRLLIEKDVRPLEVRFLEAIRFIVPTLEPEQRIILGIVPLTEIKDQIIVDFFSAILRMLPAQAKLIVGQCDNDILVRQSDFCPSNRLEADVAGQLEIDQIRQICSQTLQSDGIEKRLLLILAHVIHPVSIDELALFMKTSQKELKQALKTPQLETMLARVGQDGMRLAFPRLCRAVENNISKTAPENFTDLDAQVLGYYKERLAQKKDYTAALYHSLGLFRISDLSTVADQTLANYPAKMAMGGGELCELELNHALQLANGNQDPTRAKLFLALAEVREACRRNKEALEALEPAIELLQKENLQNDLRYAFELQGRAAFALREVDTAQSAFEKSLKLARDLDQASVVADLLSQFGYLHYATQKFDRAEALYQEALEAYKGLSQVDSDQSRRGTASQWSNLGHTHFARGDFAKAEECHSTSLEIYESIDHKKAVANQWGYIGHTLFSAQDYDKAVQAYERAAALDEELGDPRAAAQRHANVGHGMYAQRNPELALRSFKKALAKYEALGDPEGEAAQLSNLGLVEGDQGEFDRAIEFFNQAKQIYSSLGDAINEITQIVRLGHVRRAQGDFKSARKHYEEAFGRYHELGYALGEGDTALELGHVNAEMQKFSEAADSYQQAQAIFAKLGHTEKEAMCLVLIGQVYKGDGKLEASMGCFEKAMGMYKQTDNALGSANVLFQMGLLHFDQQNYDQAKQSYGEALKIFRQKNDQEGEANLLANLGTLHYQIKQMDQARKHFTEAVSLLRRMNHPVGLAGVLSNLSFIYEEEKRYGEAYDCIKEAREIYQQMRMSEEEKIVTQHLEALEQKAGSSLADLRAELLNGQGNRKTKTGKVGRNDPCPCGSGKKYKKCCGG